jgi:hypothetical protein
LTARAPGDSLRGEEGFLMAYEGNVLDACGLLAIDLSDIAVVAVSGSGPNVCGHLLIHSYAGTGCYFHVAGVHTYPHYMPGNTFRRYLRENDKHELRRVRMRLPDPAGARGYMERALSSRWRWGVLPHNCVTFCEEVIRAGGGTWGSYSNCPAIATDVPQYEISRWMNGLENEIYRAYGVPR